MNRREVHHVFGEMFLTLEVRVLLLSVVLEVPVKLPVVPRAAVRPADELPGALGIRSGPLPCMLVIGEDLGELGKGPRSGSAQRFEEVPLVNAQDSQESIEVADQIRPGRGVQNFVFHFL